MSKSIFIFNDGTSQSLKSEFNSNVAKMYKALPGTVIKRSSLKCGEYKEDSNLNYQALYYRGVGAKELRKEGVVVEPPKSKLEQICFSLDRIFNAVSGNSIVKRIAAVIDDLEETWEPGDKVYLIGFSRGSSSIRIAAHYLNQIERLSNLKIEYMLIFDTVYSVFVPIQVRNFKKLNSFKNKEIGAHIKKCDHLISGDEMRQGFSLTPVKLREGVRQILFPGCHSDVGGGLSSAKLSDISLTFAIEEFKTIGVKFDKERIDSLGISPDPCGKIGWDRFGGTAQTHYPRDFRDIDFKIHQSVAIRARQKIRVPIALAQLGEYQFGYEELLNPTDAKVKF